MFLKLFPRYAGRARRGATVAGDNLRGTAVLVENAPKSLSRTRWGQRHSRLPAEVCGARCRDLGGSVLCDSALRIRLPLCAGVAPLRRYEAVETLSTYGENESFRICVQIRTIRGKAKGLHA